MNGTRVIVIGAGAAGLSAAWHAARLGAKSVTVLEQHHLANGSSGLSAGIVNRQTIDPTDRQMRIDSVRVLDDFVERGLLAIDRCGYVRLAKSQDQVDLIHRTLEADPAASAFSRFVTADEIADLAPGIQTRDLAGGMYGPFDGSLDGPELCQAYLAVARELGVEYHGRSPVIDIRRRLRAITVATATDSFDCDVLINAAGPWLQQVASLMELPVAIDNQRHQIALLHVPSLSTERLPTIQSYFPGSGGDAIYVRPEGPGRFIVGLHSYEHQTESANPDDYRKRLDPHYFEELAEALAERFPGWEDASLSDGWTGLYPLGPDGRFLIGPHRADPRVVVLGGLGGVGLTVSPAAGRLAAEWAVLGEPSEFPWAESLLPDRASLTTEGVVP